MIDLRTIVAEAMSDSLSAGSPGTFLATAGDVLDAMAATSNRAALTAWLVSGVLVQAESETDDGGQGLLWIQDVPTRYGDTGDTAPMVEIGTSAFGEHHQLVPVYRIGGERA